MSIDLTASLHLAALARTDAANAPPRSTASALRGLTRDQTMSFRVARALVEAIEQRGRIPRERILRAARLSPEDLDTSESRISRNKISRLCELALDLTCDPAFGLHWAAQAERSLFGPLSDLVMHAATLRQGLDTLARFFRLVSDDASYQLLEHDDDAIVRCTPLAGEPLRVQRFAAEVMTLRFLRILRCFHADAVPSRISFAHAAPSHRAEYARFFEQAVQFEQPFTEIAFDRTLLDRPSGYGDEEVYLALRQIAERRLHRDTHPAPYAQRVRELLLQRGCRHGTDMETVARALGLSVRSLRRRLSAEGVRYDEVADETLAALARQLLCEPQRTIQEVGHALGFCNSSAFHRAFKRWTGLTPNEYRQAQPLDTSREHRPDSGKADLLRSGAPR